MAESLQTAQERARAKIQRPEGLPSLGGPRRSNGPFLVLMGVIAVAVLFMLWMTRPESSTPVTHVGPATTTIPQPTVTAKPLASNSGIQLQGIVMGGGTPYAMINGEILSTGDSVGNYTVQSIQATQVILQDSSGRNKSLALYPEES